MRQGPAGNGTRGHDDPAITNEYEDYKEAVWEWNSALATARRNGLAEGCAEGERVGRAGGVDSLARELRALGVDASIIDRAVAAAT